MPVKYYLLFMMFFSCSPEVFSQQKENELQVISYQPQKAKKGKDGAQRIRSGNHLKNGGRGKDGKQGPELQVRVSLIRKNMHELLQLVIQSDGEDHRADTVYVDPRYGQVKIMADGGEGGNAGKGEEGMNNGSGGKGGDGGKIELIFDASAISFSDCSCLLFSNAGGTGGREGEQLEKSAESGKAGPPVMFKNEAGLIIRL